MNLQQFYHFHYENKDNDKQRLGQRFVNQYMKNSWPELFYETSDSKAKLLIEGWLKDHNYLYGQMPVPLKPFYAGITAIGGHSGHGGTQYI